YLETNDVQDMDTFLDLYAKSGYKLLVYDEKQRQTSYGPAFKRDTIDQAAIQAVLDGEEYHGMRDFPGKPFTTGFIADETANTVGIPLTYQDENYALFLRPNIKMLFKEAHYLFAGMIFFMIFVTMVAVIYMARRIIQAVTSIT